MCSPGQPSHCAPTPSNQHSHPSHSGPTHLPPQLLHKRLQLAEQVVALMEEGQLGVHEGEHLKGRGYTAAGWTTLGQASAHTQGLLCFQLIGHRL